MHKELQAALPELTLIQDAALRDKVLNVWVEALTIGGFSVREMVEMPFSPALADTTSMTYLGHIRAVTQMCVGMADVVLKSYGARVPVDRDVLIAGSLLADVGKLVEYEKRADGSLRKGHRGEMLRHPFTGTALAFKHDLPYDVMHIIAVHSREGDFVNRSREAIIYHHAANADFDLAR